MNQVTKQVTPAGTPDLAAQVASLQVQLQPKNQPFYKTRWFERTAIGLGGAIVGAGGVLAYQHFTAPEEKVGLIGNDDNQYTPVHELVAPPAMH